MTAAAVDSALRWRQPRRRIAPDGERAAWLPGRIDGVRRDRGPLRRRLRKREAAGVRPAPTCSTPRSGRAVGGRLVRDAARACSLSRAGHRPASRRRRRRRVPPTMPTNVARTSRPPTLPTRRVARGARRGRRLVGRRSRVKPGGRTPSITADAIGSLVHGSATRRTPPVPAHPRSRRKPAQVAPALARLELPSRRGRRSRPGRTRPRRPSCPTRLRPHALLPCAALGDRQASRRSTPPDAPRSVDVDGPVRRLAPLDSQNVRPAGGDAGEPLA